MRPLDAPRKARAQRVREPTIAEAGPGHFPTVRMRRNRKAAWSRRKWISLRANTKNLSLACKSAQSSQFLSESRL